MSNRATLPRGTARAFQAYIQDATGTETLKLVVGLIDGEAGALTKSLTYDSGNTIFTCTITAANTTALTAGQTYRAVVWRTDSGSEDVPVIDGYFDVADTPRAS